MAATTTIARAAMSRRFTRSSYALSFQIDFAHADSAGGRWPVALDAGHQSRWFVASRTPRHATLLAGSVHGVPDPRAGQRVVSHPLPAGNGSRIHRADQRDARRQRRVGRGGLRSAHGEAPQVQLRAVAERSRDAPDPRDAADEST